MTQEIEASGSDSEVNSEPSKGPSIERARRIIVGCGSVWTIVQTLELITTASAIFMLGIMLGIMTVFFGATLGE